MVSDKQKKIFTRIAKSFAVLFCIAVVVFFVYFNNLSLVNPVVKNYYWQLKEKLSTKGYKPSLLVISTKRFGFHNAIQVMFSGAAKDSKHLSGQAIDFLVFDINKDGICDSKDVDIAYEILDKDIIGPEGGIGTYKNEGGFINKQQIHIDCRGSYARWHR